MQRTRDEATLSSPLACGLLSLILIGAAVSCRAATVRGINLRDVYAPIMISASHKSGYKIWGNVESVDSQGCVVSDGAGHRVRVIGSHSGLLLGEFVTAVGTLNVVPRPAEMSASLITPSHGNRLTPELELDIIESLKTRLNQMPLDDPEGSAELMAEFAENLPFVYLTFANGTQVDVFLLDESTWKMKMLYVDTELVYDWSSMLGASTSSQHPRLPKSSASSGRRAIVLDTTTYGVPYAFIDYFCPWTAEDYLQDIRNALTEAGYSVDYKRSSECGIPLLQSIKDYDVVIFYGHGGPSGIGLETASDCSGPDYSSLPGVLACVNRTYDGHSVSAQGKYWISADFIKENWRLPRGGLIYLMACNSGGFIDACLDPAVGADAALVHSGVVLNSAEADRARTVFSLLLGEAVLTSDEEPLAGYHNRPRRALTYSQAISCLTTSELLHIPDVPIFGGDGGKLVFQTAGRASTLTPVIVSPFDIEDIGNGVVEFSQTNLGSPSSFDPPFFESPLPGPDLLMLSGVPLLETDAGYFDADAATLEPGPLNVQSFGLTSNARYLSQYKCHMSLGTPTYDCDLCFTVWGDFGPFRENPWCDEPSYGIDRDCYSSDVTYSYAPKGHSPTTSAQYVSARIHEGSLCCWLDLNLPGNIGLTATIDAGTGVLQSDSVTVNGVSMPASVEWTGPIGGFLSESDAQ